MCLNARNQRWWRDRASSSRHRSIVIVLSHHRHRTVAPARTLSHNRYCHRTIAPLSSHLLLRHLSIDPNFDGNIENYVAQSEFHGDPFFLEWWTRGRVTIRYTKTQMTKIYHDSVGGKDSPRNIHTQEYTAPYHVFYGARKKLNLSPNPSFQKYIF